MAIAIALSLVASTSRAEEGFWVSPDSGNWYDPTNWAGFIPLEAGDIAHVGGQGGDTTITLDAPVTLAELEIVERGRVRIGGDGPLLFDNPGTHPAVLRSPVATFYHFINTPVGIADNEQLVVDVPTGGHLLFTSGIVGGSGDLIKAGGGELRIDAGSPTWEGDLRIEGGELIVRDFEALGATSGRTTVGANARIVLGDGGTSQESFVLDGEMFHRQ